MALHKHKLLLLFIILLVGCRDARPERHSFSKSQAQGANVEVPMESAPESNVHEFVAGGGTGPMNSTEINAKDGSLKTRFSLQYSKIISRDAYNFTHGVLALDIPMLENGTKMGFQRFLYADRIDKITPERRKVLNKLCQDMGVSASHEEFKPFSEMDRSHGMFLHWRSHYNFDIKNLLGTLLAENNRIFCVMKISMQGKTANESVFALLDPLPAERGFIGALDAGKASNEGIMLIDVNTQALPFDDKHMLPIEGLGGILLSIPAVNGREITISSRDIPDEQACYYAGNSKAYRVGDPDAMQFFAHDVKSERELKFVSAEPAPIGGRILEACKKVKVEQVDKSFHLSYSCESYQTVKDLGVEAACAWNLRFHNQQDPENLIAVTLPMDKTTFKTVDISKYTEVIQVLPKAAENPVRTGKTVFLNFSPERLKSVEQAFDFWLAIDPASFKAEYEDYVPRITYLSDKPDECGTSGGFVDKIGSPFINLCPHGALLDEDLAQNASNPHLPVYRAILLAHETRHTRGLYHDWEKTEYKPCEGTSAAARIAYNLATQCKTDYCSVMRDAALFNFVYELNYSLKDDQRRFEGQCKSWADEMGLVPADFSKR